MPDVSGSHPFQNAVERLKKTETERADDARRSREKVLSRTDGRVLRGKGKNVTVNYRVTPQFKQDVYDMAQTEHITMTEVLERAVELYKQHKGKR